MSDSAKTQKNSLWKQLAGIAIAGALLWLAFRGIDPEQFLTYLKTIKLEFVLLLFVSGVMSHFLRAVRWVILLKPLADRKISLWNSFCAVLIGYAVNVVIPRGGEVARLVSVARSERLPWAGVLPTMFIDRLLDLALLVLLLAFTLIVLPSKATADFPWLVPGGVSLALASLAGLAALPFMGDIIKKLLAVPALRTRLPAAVAQKVSDLAEQFDLGTRSLRSPISYPAIALLSLAIWFCYWLNFYLMIWGFGLNTVVSATQCLIVFTIGSVGVLVPTPGSVGSFHFLVSQALMMVSGVNKDQALAYASVLHILCFVIVTCIPAAICVALQSALSGKDNQKGAGDKAAQSGLNQPDSALPDRQA